MNEYFYYPEFPEPFPVHGLNDTRSRILRTAVGKCQNTECTNTVRLVVDHDHLTGKIRGILCGICNNTLGSAKDDVARLRGLADYLENPPLDGVEVSKIKHSTRGITEEFFNDLEQDPPAMY